ncbi:MAG TPA: nuclear transport factor 2 family protein [Stellaceae bacterium]|nr:nuclear transport factor 2 family protein [Stellaceae bacterium]
MPFAELLQRFAAAVMTDDRKGLSALFTPDGVYEDGFFGAHAGPAAIAAMLRRFHDTGANYLWEFVDPIAAGDRGYARFHFSYVSRLPDSAGRPVFFEGMSCFTLRDGLIARYREAFDRGVALVQLDFPAERIRRILERATAAQNRSPAAERHLARFAKG